MGYELKNRMEGLVLIKEENNMINNIDAMIEDFREEGFDDHQIKSYLISIIKRSLAK